MRDYDAMGRALELAWRGWGRVAPNPLVGAVVLRDGQVLSEGWHVEFGTAHAEAVAVALAGSAARGATLVLTLEPCNHQGKQPPCTEALIAAGVAKVVAAVADPNPVAAGGAQRLRAAGMEVTLGLREEEARAQNAVFFHRWSGCRRPFVALKLATTLDGRIADHSGRSRWISGEEARDYVHWLRAGFDAIGVGGHTASLDDASLTVRGRTEPRIPPRRVVFTRQGDLSRNLTLVRTAREIPTIVLAGGLAPTGHLADLEAAGVTVQRMESLAHGLELLRAAGIESLLVEGGGRLAGVLLQQGLVDRYYWIQAPVWLGDDGVPAMSGLPGRTLAAAERWTVVERRSLGQDTLLVVDREPCSPAS